MLLVKIAWRSIWRSKRRTFITVSALSFALSLVVFFIAFAEGVYAGMINEAVRMQAGHVTIEHRDYHDAPATDLTVADAPALRIKLAALDGVASTKLLVLGQGVAKSGNGAEGVAIMGVEPSVEAKASPLENKITRGSYLDEGDTRVVVIGQTLAERLKLDLGKKLVLSTNNTKGELVEELVRVKGIFATGVVEIDGYVVQTPLGFAQELFQLGPHEVTRIGLVLADADREEEILRAARRIIAAPAVARPWEEVLPDLAAYVRFDGGSNYIIQGLLIFLSLFTIFNTILMSVLERSREFAMMLALGTDSLRIRAQVVLESAMIGVLGCGIGLLVGGIVALALQIHGFDLKSIYPEGIAVSGVSVGTRVYGQVTVKLLATLGGLVFAATLVTSLIAVRHISRIEPAAVLR